MPCVLPGLAFAGWASTDGFVRDAGGAATGYAGHLLDLLRSSRRSYTIASLLDQGTPRRIVAKLPQRGVNVLHDLVLMTQADGLGVSRIRRRPMPLRALIELYPCLEGAS
jgi:hypothetical protein